MQKSHLVSVAEQTGLEPEDRFICNDTPKIIMVKFHLDYICQVFMGGMTTIHLRKFRQDYKDMSG